MTPNTVQTAIPGAQLASLPRERASANEAGETSSFAATLGGALASSGDAEPVETQQAPGARHGARTAPAKDDRHDKAEGNLLAALLALGALPIAVPADAASQATQPAATAGNAAASGTTLADGLPASAALASLAGSPAGDATPLEAGALQPGQAGTEPAQTGRGATTLPMDAARIEAARAHATQADAARAAATPIAPAADPATLRDRPAADAIAARLIDGQPRAAQPASDARPAAQARATPEGATQPLSPLAVGPVGGSATTGTPADSSRGDDARDATPIAARAADAASRSASPPAQVALVRPSGSGRDEHARESSDASGPAAPATGPLSAPASADLPRPGAIAAQVAAPVGSEQWPAALSQQVLRVGSGREVELNLNPAELGPLKVKLTLDQGQAQVMFVSEHASVRQAIEAALPQLRSSFADNGISLGQATVGSGSGDAAARQPQDQPPRQQSRSFEANAQAGEPSRAPLAARAGRPASAVDTFA